MLKTSCLQPKPELAWLMSLFSLNQISSWFMSLFSLNQNSSWFMSLFSLNQNSSWFISLFSLNQNMPLLSLLTDSLHQCFPTFFQPRHTFLEPITRRPTAFMTPNLYTRLAYDV